MFDIDSSWLQPSTAFVIISFTCWYLYYKYCFTYWSKKGVPSVPPTFPTGNITKSLLGQESIFVAVEKLHRRFKKEGKRHGGIYFFNGPIYLPVDLEIIKSILVTDFEHFVDRGTFIDDKKFPLGSHIFSMTGQEWKNLRNKLSPNYTSGKLKSMFEAMRDVAENFLRSLESSDEINIKRKSEHFTADMICSTGFGVKFNIIDNPEQELSGILKRMLKPPALTFIKQVLTGDLQNPGNLIKGVMSDKVLEKFFKTFVKDVMDVYKSNGEKVNNLFNTLLEINKAGGISPDEILGESFLFFLAGFETSSATISFCIHELAHNQDIQERLRKEIIANLGSDCAKFSYDGVWNLKYLDQVFQETLRKYPVLGVFNRICVKPYKIPGTDIILEKGTPVLISTLGVQRDPEYFPDPLKFDPERFGENASHEPFAFMPFGEGPRFCIGMRLGKLQTKMGIASLIAKYRFLPSEKTPRNIEYDKVSTSLAMTPKEGITVKIEKL